ncbi:MAG TPA: DUF4446 family protein [Chloroflexi bacterium]|nr:DUF4446 family protein [Chloroflexota bacterium]
MDIALLIWAIALTILVIFFIVWVFDLQARISRMQKQQKNLFSGEFEEEVDGDVMAAIAKLSARLNETNARTERLVAHSQQVNAVFAHTIQGMALVRYRAFQDTGGDQSFSLALVDGEGNGAVISALYGRGATRVYAKPVDGWQSPKVLSDEEAQALAEARQIVLGQSKSDN